VASFRIIKTLIGCAKLLHVGLKTDVATPALATFCQLRLCSGGVPYVGKGSEPFKLFNTDRVPGSAARKPSVIDMEDLDIAIHSWDINPEHIEICKRPSGRPWMLGSGARLVMLVAASDSLACVCTE